MLFRYNKNIFACTFFLSLVIFNLDAQNFSCPSNTDLGTFDCTNINDVPEKPNTLSEAMAAPYGIVIIGALSQTRATTEDSDIIFYCQVNARQITRTVIIYNDNNFNFAYDSGEEIGSCNFIIDVGLDSNAPTFEAPPDAITSCSIGYNPDITGNVIIAEDGECPFVISQDNVVYSDAIAEGTCLGELFVARAWTALDECGNTSQSQTQFIIVDCPPSCSNDDICAGDRVTDPLPGQCDCQIIEVRMLGCTNPTACNYNPNANCDDDSCFFDCNTTNVYPGDKNNDGIVDQKDVSIAGFLYETGPARAPQHQNILWQGYPCEDWNDNLPFNGANIKHLDCNGNGIIETTDIDAVLQNIGQTHNEGGAQIGTFDFENTDYQIYLQPTGTISSNETQLEFNVVLESKNSNNITLQGGYFTIDYNNVNTNITNAAMNFSNSWLGSPNINMVESFSNFPNFQQIEIGFSKTNGANSTGKGIIGQLTFVLDNNAMRTANSLLDFEVIEIGVHDSQGNIQPIEEQLLQVGLNESNCQTNWTITEDSPFYNFYKSNGTIATDGFVLIGKEQQVQYSANRVSLKEGFSVRAGAGFKVRSFGCN